MSAHRINYRPTPANRQPRAVVGGWRGALSALCVVLSTLWAVSIYPEPAPSPIDPVNAFGPEPGPMDAQRLAQIRLEAFRAGMQSAQEGNGCALAHPLMRAPATERTQVTP